MFCVDDIDGCEFVKSLGVGHMLVSFDTDSNGIPTGKIRVVYADGSSKAISYEEAQERFDSGYWKVVR